MVPIRDPGLVGKKIDCPKCKYRFLVEEPAPEEDEDGAEQEQSKSTAVTDKKGKRKLRDDSIPPDEDEEGKGKSKGPNTTVLYVGIGLGVIAVVALIGGGILLWSGPAKPAGGAVAGAGGGGGGSAPKGNTTTAPTLIASGQSSEPVPPAPEPEAGPIDDITNILPNATSALVSLDPKALMKSSLKHSLLEVPGGFSDATFKRTFDFEVDNVVRLLTAVLPGEQPGAAAFFSVLKLEKPCNREFLKKSLKLDPLPAINGLESFTVNGDLDTLGAMFLRLATPQTEKMTVHFVDSTTLVFADAAPMRQFLESKRQPTQLTQPPPPRPDDGLPPASQTAPAVGIIPSTPGAAPIGPRTGAKGLPSAGGGVRPNAAGEGDHPRITLFQQPGGPRTDDIRRRGQGIEVQGAGTPESPAIPSKAVEAEATASPSYLTIDPSLKIAIDRIESEKATPEKPLPIFFVAVLLSKANIIPPELGSMAAIDRSLVDKLIPRAPMPEGASVIAAALRDFSEVTASGMLVFEFISAERAKEGKAMIDYASELGADLVKNAWEIDLKTSTTAAPAAMAGAAPNSRFLTRGAGPGAAYTPPQPQPGQAPSTATGKDGVIASSIRDKTIVLSIDVTLSGTNKSRELYEALRDGLSSEMVQMKGMSELVASRPRIHELAKALQAYVKEKKSFPRGAMQRPPSADRGIEWYPDQRLSWMVELLPYLGDGEFKELLFKPEKSWNEGENLLTAQVTIPQFLSPGDPKNAHVHYPGKVGLFATTRFVAVAGVGLDAASYDAKDPNLAKKVGIFGYDRVTKVDDIRDEAENTIALIQIPSGQITPWLAGGGATVRGISEGDDAIKPFVCAEYKGKRGTFAVMADSKVRFIPEDIKPADFRALCTIAGGERILDIDSIAPVVPASDASELKTAPSLTPPPLASAKTESSPPAAAQQTPQTQPMVIPKIPLPPNWKDLVDESAAYAVAVPEGTPLTPPLPQVQSALDTKSSGVTDKDGSTFAIWQIKLRVDVPSTELPNLFKIVQEKLVQEGKISGQREIEIDAFKGKEWISTTPQSVKFCTRCYAVKNQVFVLKAGGPKAEWKDVQFFLDSFRVLKK
jgi:hypothetical protein